MGGKGFSGGKPKSSYGYPLRPLGGLRRSPLAVRRRFSVRCHGCRDKEIHNLCTLLWFAPFEISTTNLLCKDDMASMILLRSFTAISRQWVSSMRDTAKPLWSAVRPLAPPVYPAGYLRRVGHVGGPAVRGCDDLAARLAFVISFSPPPREDLLEAPDEGVEDEVLHLTAARVDPTERELGNYGVSRVDPTEHELGNYDVSRVDPTEHELGNCNAARVDPTERELGNYDVSRVDPTEHELGNCNAARVDPTEHELGNYGVELLPRMKSGANPEIGRSRTQIRRFGREGDLGRKFGDFGREGELGRKFGDFGREGELGRKSRDLAEKVNSGTNSEIRPRG
ncbi:hypothetical protein BHM03_00035039 [Ensete ventricosum]|nr:hypothetical protein BHM03_00035039 [Ensete ventricosum]